jgi:GNAT superfamily N-acetyltransferase
MRDLPAWQIRKAAPDDGGALALVGAATFLETYAGLVDGAALVAHCAANHSPDTYRNYFAKGAQAWLAEVDPGGAPVGFALLTAPDLEAAQPGDIQLQRIYSFSRWHGSGIGTDLLQAALTGCTGYTRLLLGVYRLNSRAITFYGRHGFTPIATRQFDVGGTLYDDLVLARSLAA